MQRIAILALVALATLSVAPDLARAEQPADPPASETIETTEALWRTVDLSRGVPAALAAPEGTTRWELAGLRGEPAAEIRGLEIPAGGSAPRATLRPAGAERERAATLLWRDPAGGDAALRRLQPQRAPGFGGTDPVFLELERVDGDGRVERLRIESRRAGIGWAILPSGPREVVLERSRILATGPGGATVPRVEYRWIDPRVGPVLVASGPADASGRAPAYLDRAEWLEEIVAGPRGTGLRIYADQVSDDTFGRLAYGIDRGEGTPVSAVTPDPVTTIGQLAALSAWDFSANDATTAVAETASTAGPVTQAQTCSYNQCGFNRPGARLSREDKNFDDPPNLNITLSVVEEEQRAADLTLWLRAGVRNEGVAGSFGDGESRFCYVDSGRSEVPLWRFPHQDANGWYMQSGDSWASATFDCEQNVFNHVCPNACGFLCPIYTAPCDDFDGNQRGAVINEGPVTLPSGHTFQSLVVRNVAEFCVYISGNCGIPVDSARTAIYLWQAPHVGTVARLMSFQTAEPDELSFTTLEETDIKYGLFPPLSVQVDGATDTTLDVSWNPGTDTRRITGYRIYWDTDSGGASPYAFDSSSQPGQVQFDGTSATISGLQPGTGYFVTVTALSDYQNPATGLTTQYESVIFPTTVPTGGAPIPVEVQASTTGGGCVPTAEVGGLVATSVAGDTVTFCWNAPADPCIEGYDVLSAASPEAEGNFGVALSGDDATCAAASTADGYFLVVGRGGGGQGPWGHFGR